MLLATYQGMTQLADQVATAALLPAGSWSEQSRAAVGTLHTGLSDDKSPASTLAAMRCGPLLVPRGSHGGNRLADRSAAAPQPARAAGSAAGAVAAKSPTGFCALCCGAFLKAAPRVKIEAGERACLAWSLVRAAGGPGRKPGYDAILTAGRKHRWQKPDRSVGAIQYEGTVCCGRLDRHSDGISPLTWLRWSLCGPWLSVGAGANLATPAAWKTAIGSTSLREPRIALGCGCRAVRGSAC